MKRKILSFLLFTGIASAAGAQCPNYIGANVDSVVSQVSALMVAPGGQVSIATGASYVDVVNDYVAINARVFKNSAGNVTSVFLTGANDAFITMHLVPSLAGCNGLVHVGSFFITDKMKVVVSSNNYSVKSVSFEKR